MFLSYLTILVFCIWFYGLIAQLQLFVFNTIIILGVHIKIVVVASILVFILTHLSINSVRVSSDKSLNASWKMFFFVIVIDSLISWYVNDNSAIYVLFSLNVMYFFPILLIFLLWFYNTVDIRSLKFDRRLKSSKIVTRVSYYLGLPIILFGIIQFILRDPIIATQSDDYLTISSYDFIGGGVRAFSIFTSGLAFGKYALFVMLLWLCEVIKGTRHARLATITHIFLVALCIFAIFATMTRSIYIHMGMSIFSFYLIYKGVNWLWIKLLLFVSLISGCILIFIIPALPENLFDAQGVFNTASMSARFGHWDKVYEFIDSGSLINLLFGFGLIQNERFELTQGLIIDNVYLALFLYGGIVSLLVVLIFYYRLIVYSYKMARNSGNSLWMSASSFMLGVPVASLFSVQINSSFIIIVIAFLAGHVLEKRVKLVNFQK